MASINYIAETANKLVRKYKTRDPYKLCREIGIKVRLKDLGRDVKAYFICVSRIKNIVLNNNVSERIRRILAAHELGHAVLHGDAAMMKGMFELEMFDMTLPTEYEANIFAAELLIDDDELLALLNDNEKSFFGVASELYVPAALLDFKFRVLKHKGYRLEAPILSRGDFLKDLDECYGGDYYD